MGGRGEGGGILLFGSAYHLAKEALSLLPLCPLFDLFTAFAHPSKQERKQVFGEGLVKLA